MLPLIRRSDGQPALWLSDQCQLVMAEGGEKEHRGSICHYYPGIISAKNYLLKNYPFKNYWRIICPELRCLQQPVLWLSDQCQLVMAEGGKGEGEKKHNGGSICHYTRIICAEFFRLRIVN